MRYLNHYFGSENQKFHTVLTLKRLAGELNEDFNNKKEHDVYEFLNFRISTLHEGIKLNYNKKNLLIDNNSGNENNNSLDEIGNIHWSKSLLKNASIIDSIFKYQLRIESKCKTCGNIINNFENNYILNLPILKNRLIQVEIYLYKLPFQYKLYYAEINEKFENYIKQEQNLNKSLIINLWNYFVDELNLEEKKNQSLILHFNLELESDVTMIEFVKLLRRMKLLELENEKLKKIKMNDDILLYEVEHYTNLITYSKEKNKIIYPEEELDKYSNIDNKIIINVYEVLNLKGIKKVFEEFNKINFKMNLYSFTLIKYKPKVSMM